MILAMDIGNTNIKVGLWNDTELAGYWRLATNKTATSDEYGILLSNLFAHDGLDMKQVDGIIISSVVPTINYTIDHMCQSYFKLNPLFVAMGIKTGINILYENPRELGSDRIVNAAAAYTVYGGPVIFIDFGTATSFGAVNASGSFLGGVIVPGIKLASEALGSGTAKLPRFELARPDHVIGRTTLTNLQSGMYYGYIGQVSHLVKLMKEEMGGNPRVIATGGMAQMIADGSGVIDQVDGLLTLKGLRIIWEKNKK